MLSLANLTPRFVTRLKSDVLCALVQQVPITQYDELPPSPEDIIYHAWLQGMLTDPSTIYEVTRF